MLIARGDAGPVELLRADIAWTPSAHCLALNFGPDGTALFVDGALAAKGAGTWPVPPKVAGLVFGSTWTGSASAEGDLDEIQVFGRPLSELAMAWYYATHAGQAALGPVSEAEWQAQREAAAKRRAEREAAGAGGGAQMLRLVGGTSECITNLPLYITNIFSTNITGQGWTVQFDIQGTNAFGPLQDIFTTTNLLGTNSTISITNSQWAWLERGPACSTYQYTNQPDAFAFYVLGTLLDSDNDGLTDAYENLVSRTATNVANSPRAIYEGVISNQFPNNWFKLNDGSLANAISGQPALTNSGAVWDVDVFATGSNSIQFNGTSQRLTAGDVINGGTGTNQGSFSLLFRSLPSHPTNNLTTRRYVFSQGGNITNELGLFFEPTNTTPDSGSLKLQIGGQTNILLASDASVFGTWYYLALTWKESSNRATWYLSRIGGALSSSNVNFGATNAVGNSSNVVFGNRQNAPGNASTNYTNAFRIPPGNGALDQLAFWNRELTADEINAQFNTLAALFQGPSKAFDLSRWNILLPVDTTNGLNTSNLAQEISTGWLNSGFKYLDPADWTQKYFYLSNGNTMVFEAPSNGARSSGGSGARSELRGTLADGSEDNWRLLGTNMLEATCAVHSNGTNGTNKVIIGQIYCESTSTPTFAVNYNYPQLKQVTVTYKTNSAGSGSDRNLTLATNVNLLDLIRYKIQLFDDGTNVILHGEASTNGVAYPPPLNVTLASTPSDAWHTNTFYFKAGCYYPNGPISGTAKVTFSSLTATHQP